MKSQWVPVPGFSRYEIHPSGRVRDTQIRRKGKPLVLKRDPTHNGYMRVRLRNEDGKLVAIRLHLLVLNVFVGPPPSPRHKGCHYPKSDKRLNGVANLKWGTPEENEAHKRFAGSWRTGKRTVLTDAAVLAIREAARNGASFTKIAAAFNLHRHSVSRICRNLRRAPKGSSHEHELPQDETL